MKSPAFWASLPLGPGVTLLEHDANGLAALSKPAGVLSHPNTSGDEPRSLLNAPYDFNGEYYELKGQPDSVRFWLINRLDSATSGVILAASDGLLAEEVRDQFKRRQVGKIYNALVFGRPKLEGEVWRDRLSVEKRGGQIRTKEGHIPAECRMSVEQTGGGPFPLALIRLEPQTGRSHQLRVQCAKRGLPIVGDQTYGDFKRNREFAKIAGSKRLFLHSRETVFSYEFQGGTHTFSARAPLPPEFKGCLPG